MPAGIISMEAARVDNAILLDYLTSEVAPEEPEIGSTDQNIPIYKNCMDDELHFWMPGGRREDEDDESDERDPILTASRRQRPATELPRFALGTRDVDGDEGEDGDEADADADEEKEASQADDWSMQNVDDWGHIRFDMWTSAVGGYECEDGDDADTDEEEEASQVESGSTQNVHDWAHSTRECEDRTVSLRHV